MAQAEILERVDVEQRQPAREQLAVDDALRQAGDDAEADALRQFVERAADALHVARLEARQAVAQHDPVDRAAVGLAARLARVPHHLGEEARAADLVRLGIDLADQVEVDEAVVHRRDQRVGAGERGAGERRVAARRVDDDEVEPAPTPSRRSRARRVAPSPSRVAVVGDHRDLGLDEREARASWRRRRGSRGSARPSAAARRGRSTPTRAPVVGQRDGDMDRRRRLARPALLVAEDDQMCLLRRHCPRPAVPVAPSLVVAVSRSRPRSAEVRASRRLA